jgi:NAD(P)-dependent dehydrogenase (short-subunit alcohol dehydrogenase family)
MKRISIDQQVVVVVGCASGIGRETVLQFAQRGARIVAADIDVDGLHSLVAEVRQSGGNIHDVHTDVADFSQVQAVANEAVTHFGRIDTWIHIAAAGLFARFMETTPEEFKRVIEVDLLGQVYGAKAALPHLIESSGGLICISSIEARRALPFHSAYSSAKHGIDGFLEALRVELQHDKIPVTVTQVLPATINTPFFSKSMTKIGVQPMAPPPVYSPAVVARTILHVTEHPVRDIVVGGAGKGLLTMQRISPSVLDAALSRVGYKAQQTSQPKSADAPNALYGPVGTDNQVEGQFGKFAFSHSLSTWLDLHPVVKNGAFIGAALGLGALMGRGPGTGSRRVSTVPATDQTRVAGVR